MEKVYASYPNDHEAAAFFALSLLASELHNDKDFVNLKRAAILESSLLLNQVTQE